MANHKSDTYLLKRFNKDAYRAFQWGRRALGGYNYKKLWVCEDSDSENVLCICTLSNEDFKKIRTALLEHDVLLGSSRGFVAYGESNVCYVELNRPKKRSAKKRVKGYNKTMATKPTLNSIFTAGIEHYTGRKVKELKIHSDPKVAGTYAIRCFFADKGSKKTSTVTQIDFLIIGQYVEGGIRKASPELISENLEEIQCETWPPKSGNPRFFV